MTLNTEDMIRKQLNHSFARHLTPLDEMNSNDVFLTDTSGQSLYDIAITDETGIWAWLANTLNDADTDHTTEETTPLYTDHPTPTITETTPDTAIIAQSESSHASAWLLGGLSLASLMVAGTAIAHHHHHHEPDHLPKPQAIVMRYSPSENPNPSEPNATTQAENPPATTESPHDHPNPEPPHIIPMQPEPLLSEHHTRTADNEEETPPLPMDSEINPHYSLTEAVLPLTEQHDDGIINNILL